jgi:oligosaccharide repeat unit polymerase
MLVTDMNIFSNPNFLYIFIWSCLLIFQSFEITNNYINSNIVGFGIIGVNLFFAVLLQIIFIRRGHVYDIRRDLVDFLDEKLQKINHVIKWFLGIYFILSVLDVIYSGGFPIYWILTGSEKLYVDFGVPTLHGVANGIIFFLFTLLILLETLGFKKFRLILILLFSWQILILSRGVIMVIGAQSLCVILLLSQARLTKIWRYIIFTFFVIIGFGYFGDLRQGYNPYIGLVNDNWVSVFENLPSGFLWVYVYLTSGYNNFVYNIDLITPTYFPYFSLAKLVPSVVYNVFGIEKSIDMFEFVNSGLNVSTIYSGFYSDFGILAFLPVCIIQFLAIGYYCKAKSADMFSLLKYCVLFQAIVFSPFIDTFFYLPFIVQFIFIRYLQIKLK